MNLYAFKFIMLADCYWRYPARLCYRRTL